MKMCSLVVLTLSSAALSFAQEGKPDDDIKNPLLGQPAAIAEGKRLFSEGCSGCHGTNAEGGRGPNLAKGDVVREANNRRLFASIKNGIKGTEMPPSPLPEEKIWQMVTFLRDMTS